MTRLAVSVILPTFDLSFVVDQLSKHPELSDWDRGKFDRAVSE